MHFQFTSLLCEQNETWFVKHLTLSKREVNNEFALWIIKHLWDIYSTLMDTQKTKFHLKIFLCLLLCQLSEQKTDSKRQTLDIKQNSGAHTNGYDVRFERPREELIL